MMRRKESARFGGWWVWGKFLPLLAMALLLAACAPPSKSEKEMSSDIQELKKEVKAMQEKLDKLQAGQQEMLGLLKKLASVAPQTVPFPMPSPQAAAPFQAPAPLPTLTVSQLLANKDRYVGSRVTVKGKAGPINLNHKSVFLMAPEGMIEVFLDKLPDQKLVTRLTSVPIQGPLTVTGVVSLPPGASGAKLQITAEAVEF